MAISRSIVYGGVTILAVASFLFLQGSEPDKASVSRQAAKPEVSGKPEDAANSYHGPPFEEPKEPLRDIFKPVVNSSDQVAAAGAIQPARVPSELTGGDPNWAYTGYAEVDGKKLALLENSASKQSGFLKEGEHWKKATVFRITPQTIVFADQNGVQETVLRFNGNDQPKPKAPSDSGFQPVNVQSAMQGSIPQNNMSLPQVEGGGITFEIKGN